MGTPKRCAEPKATSAPSAPGDATQARRAVVHGVETRDHREQDLRRTDVAGGLLAANVLLARLQRHAQRGLAVPVHRDADDAARHVTLPGVLRGEKRRVRTAVTHGYAEALRRPEGHVRAQRPG